jgi:hypothetical protein
MKLFCINKYYNKYIFKKLIPRKFKNTKANLLYNSKSNKRMQQKNNIQPSGRGRGGKQGIKQSQDTQRNQSLNFLEN